MASQQPPGMASRSAVIQLPNGQPTIPPHVSAQPIANGHHQHSLPRQQQPQGPPQEVTPFQKLQAENAEAWLGVGKIAEIMGDFERAVAAYDASLRNAPYSIPTLKAIANLYRSKELYSKAVDYYQSILTLNQNSGETWGYLG